MSKLKVYGWRGHRAECPTAPNGSHQTREIMAANSVAEVLRATGMSRNTWNNDGGETGNPMEIAVAMANPGNVYWKPYNDHASTGTWTGPKGAPTIEPMTRTRLWLSSLPAGHTNHMEQAAAALLAAVDATLAIHADDGNGGCLECIDPDTNTPYRFGHCPIAQAIETHTRNLP